MLYFRFAENTQLTKTQREFSGERYWKSPLLLEHMNEMKKYYTLVSEFCKCHMRKLYLLISILCLLSCKKVDKKSPETIIPYVGIDLIEFKFPDTVFTNQKNGGEIVYKSIYDTFTKSFHNEKKCRYVRFIKSHISDSINEAMTYAEYDKFEKTTVDTFGARNNRSIPIYDISFSKPGIKFITGRIEDLIMTDTFVMKDGKKNQMTRLRTKSAVIQTKVIVIKK